MTEETGDRETCELKKQGTRTKHALAPVLEAKYLNHTINLVGADVSYIHPNTFVLFLMDPKYKGFPLFRFP